MILNMEEVGNEVAELNIDCEVKVTADCDFCEKEIDLDNECVWTAHHECEYSENLKNTIEKIKDILNKKEWEDHDGYVGFENKDEKDGFMRGIKFGMEHAFFCYVSDSFGDEGVSLFEKIVGWK